MQELKTGQKLIERGEMDGAITLFKSLSLSGSPETTAEALHALGVALFQKHPSAATAKEALSYIDKALSQQPQNARFHNSRGIILEKTGNKESALESFRSAVELAPRSTKFLVNLAKLHKSQNDFIEALRYMQLVADIDPKYPEISHKIATLYKALGDKDRAVKYFRQQLETDPNHDYARFWVSVLTGEGQRDVFKPRMVAALFDSYADTFESHLQVTLGYKTPEVLFALLKETAAGKGWTFDAASGEDKAFTFKRGVDLGCGTGLMGPLLRPHVRVLEGVDLSPKMIDQARKRPGVYDKLEAAECCDYLARAAASLADGHASTAPYDLVTAADVLVYVSDLEPLFAAARRAANGQRCIFAFSTEHLDPSSPEATECAAAAAAAAARGWLLRTTGRYAHTRAFVEGCLARTGWAVARVVHSELRKNCGEPVMGDLFLASAC